MLFGRKPIGTIAMMAGIMALPTPFVWSWSQMMEYNNDYLVEPNQRIHYDRATVSYHAFARDTLAERMQGDWLLMLDTDHQFEPDLAARMLHMLNKHDIDVLVAPYLYKSPPHPPVLYGYNPKTKQRFVIGDWKKNVELIQIHSAGAGCLMVKKKVFELIKSKLKQSPFEIIPPYSEDNSFFEKLHKLKIKAYFSPLIECPHLIYKTITLKNDYKKRDVKIRREGNVQGFR